MAPLSKKITFVLVSFLLLACEEKRQLREMHDSTGEMNKTTQAMNRTMENMNGIMLDMSNTMKIMNQTMIPMGKTMTEMNGTMQGMNRKMGTMGGTMQNMNGTMGQMADTMDGMHGTMLDMNASIGVMGNTTTGMDKKIGLMVGTMNEMNGVMGSMSGQITAVNEKMGDLVLRIDSMDGKMGNLVTQIQNMDGKMANLLACIGSMDSKMSELISQIISMDSKMGGLLAKIDAMDGKMGNLVQQITAMNKTLTQLGTDMQTMSGKLDGMSGKMSDLLGKMVEIYETARPSVALAVREQAWQKVKSAESLPEKISAAAKYFMAFEYQVYQGTGEDGREKRLALAESAAAEFFREIKSFLPASGDRETSMDLTGANEEVTALAVALHRVNEIQEEWLSHNRDQEKISMLSMLEKALRQRVTGATENGNASYIKVILADRDIAVHLLKVRMNAMVELTLGRVSPLARNGVADVMGEAVGRWWGALRTFTFSNWSLHPSNEEIDLLRELNRYLKAAVDTQMILRELGEEFNLNSMLSTGLSNMQLPSDLSSLDSQRRQLVEEMKRSRGQLLNEPQPLTAVTSESDPFKAEDPIGLLKPASTAEAIERGIENTGSQ